MEAREGPFLSSPSTWLFRKPRMLLLCTSAVTGRLISLAKNPWLDSGHVDRGAIARREGGGGHAYDSGVSFPNSQYGDRYPVARVTLVALVREVSRQHAKKAAQGGGLKPPPMVPIGYLTALAGPLPRRTLLTVQDPRSSAMTNGTARRRAVV
jgi:hypothetical protein